MEDEVKRLFAETDLTLEQIATTLQTTYKIVWGIVARNFSKEERFKRKQYNYHKSKQGIKNPMFGLCREKHHNYIGECSDGKGYRIILKPSWYTGRKGCKHVFVHTVVMCEFLGITELPPNCVVHHLDGNTTNNSIHNLALMTNSAHMRLHQLERATTSRKAYASREVEARGSHSTKEGYVETIHDWYV